MRKNELINLLNQIKGNPEVHVWNGYVGDIQPLSKLHEDVLQKERLNYFHKLLNMEEKDGGKVLSTVDEAKQILKKVHWQRSQFTSLNDKNYRKKNILILEPGPAGKTGWDRTGSVSY